MRHVPLAPAILTLALLAAPALAAPAPNSNGGGNGNGPWSNGGGNGPDRGESPTNLTTPGPEAAIGLPALLAAGAGAILYIRSRRRRPS